MDFVIPAGSNANLPKELVDKILNEAVERSVLLKLMDNRDQLIEIVNEGTIPVIGEENLDRVYRIDGTTDITTLTEMNFDIKSPDLDPVELGTYIYLKTKQLKQYPELKLDTLFRNKISRAISRTADKIALVGNTAAGGATNPVTIANGIATLAATGAITAVSYTSSNAQAILDAVAEAIDDLGNYGDQEFEDDLVIFASPDFHAACRKSANKEYVGFEIGEMPELKLKNVVKLHGIPVIRRSLLTGEKGYLVNLRGAFGGYYGKLEVDIEHKAGRRADLMVITFWFDFEWALKNGSSQAEAMVIIQKTS